MLNIDRTQKNIPLKWLEDRVSQIQQSRHVNADLLISNFSNLVQSYQRNSNARPDTYERIEVNFQDK